MFDFSEQETHDQTTDLLNEEGVEKNETKPDSPLGETGEERNKTEENMEDHENAKEPEENENETDKQKVSQHELTSLATGSKQSLSLEQPIDIENMDHDIGMLKTSLAISLQYFFSFSSIEFLFLLFVTNLRKVILACHVSSVQILCSFLFSYPYLLLFLYHNFDCIRF